MPIWSQVYPTEPNPGKYQIEQMYRTALLDDPRFFQPRDGDDFGLDLVALRERNEVRMQAPLGQLRRQAAGLWERMTKQQRILFWMGYFNSAMQYAKALAANMERALGTEKNPLALPLVEHFGNEFRAAVVQALKSDLEKNETKS